MSAVIEAFVNEATLVDFWIEKSVFRLGSGPDCDFRIEQADVPAHVATIRYRSGKYAVYNRSGSELTIANRSFASGDSEKWHAGETLTLTPDVSLRLVIDGDAAPCAQPDTEMLESYQQKRHEERRLKSVQQQEAQDLQDEEKKAARAAKSSGGSGAMLAALFLGFMLIALTGALGWMMLTQGQGSGSTFNPKRVAKSLLNHADELPPQLVTLLQETQQSIELGDRKLGKARLFRLQSELERLKADGVDLTIAQGEKRTNYEEALRSYINVYLSQLE